MNAFQNLRRDSLVFGEEPLVAPNAFLLQALCQKARAEGMRVVLDRYETDQASA